MFGISIEHILIVGVILIIVGPRRLPELGNTMGKAIKNFKDSFSGIEEASFKRIIPDEKPAASANANTANSATANASTASSTVNPSAEATPVKPPVNA